jgi:hypothetical protein
VQVVAGDRARRLDRAGGLDYPVGVAQVRAGRGFASARDEAQRARVARARGRDGGAADDRHPLVEVPAHVVGERRDERARVAGRSRIGAVERAR